MFWPNQRGASLIQVMVISTVLLLGGIIAQRILHDQRLAARSAESIDSIETLHRLIYSTLQNQEHCQVTMGDTTPAAIPLTPSGVHTTTKITAKNGTTVVAVLQDAEPYDPARVYMNSNIRIVDMRFVMPADLANLASFQVTYERFNKEAPRTKEGYGGKRIRKDINIVLQRTSAGVFQTCYATDLNYAATLFQDFCNNFGTGVDSLFYWDAVNNTCMLRDNVCVNTLFAGIQSTGVAKCMPLDQWMDIDDLIEPSGNPCDPALASDVRFVQVGSKVQINCHGAGTCTPINACPASWGPNISYSGEAIQGINWTGLGFAPGDTQHDNEPDPTICNRYIRNTTSCDGANETKECRYNNSLSTGCSASAACTPVDPCPAPWGTLTSLTSDNIQATNWTSLGWPAGETVHDLETTGSDCNRYIRNTTSCDSASETRHCRYVGTGSDGCIAAATCTPIDSCPAPWGWNLSLNLDNIQDSSWSFYGFPAGDTTYNDESDPNQCSHYIRNSTSCDSDYEVRLCRYSNSLATGCSSAACTPPPTCNAPWGGHISFTGDSIAAVNWNDLGHNPADSIHATVIDPNTCHLDIRDSTSCTADGEVRNCRYNNSLGTGCDGAIPPPCDPPPACPAPATVHPWLNNLASDSTMDPWEGTTEKTLSPQMQCQVSYQADPSCTSARYCTYDGGTCTEACEPDGRAPPPYPPKYPPSCDISIGPPGNYEEERICCDSENNLCTYGARESVNGRNCECMEYLVSDPSMPGSDYACCTAGWQPIGYTATLDCYNISHFPPHGSSTPDMWLCYPWSPYYAEVTSQCETKI